MREAGARYIPFKAMRGMGSANKTLKILRRIVETFELEKHEHAKRHILSEIYRIEALLSVLPAPSIVSHKVRPTVVIGTWSSGVDTEVDGCTTSQAFASTVVDLSPFETLLW